ncbi:MAG: DUF4398 domain-containing protein [Methylococcales bacterium]|nr:DUF4398 domain-containing protein [Methylococcales bacterium]
MKIKMENLQKIQRSRLFFVLICSSLFLVGCGGGVNSKATYKVATVQAAIATAKENRAHTYAPMELNEAEEKFRAAEAEIVKNNHEKADDLLDEALLDAKYAEAKAEADQAKTRVEEARNMIDTLRHEMMLSR